MAGKGGSGGGAGEGVQAIYDKNQEATIYIGNVDDRADEEILWELFMQAGPLTSVNLPKDKITTRHMGYAFIEYKTEEDCDYACKVMNMVKLFGKPLRCTKSSTGHKSNDVGANLFVGNLDLSCDDKILYDTFASFGHLLFAKVMKDPDTGESRGFGFISYDAFESADAAMAAMNGQFLCNSPIQVSYALKKDSRGERHGDASERLIAENLAKQQPVGVHLNQQAPMAMGGKGGPEGGMNPPPFNGKGGMMKGGPMNGPMGMMGKGSGANNMPLGGGPGGPPQFGAAPPPFNKGNPNGGPMMPPPSMKGRF